MHYVAGALLIAQFVLMWAVDASIGVQGLETLAWAVWLLAVALLAASTLTLRSRGQAPEGRDFVETEALVATGVNGLVRHPMYLGWALMYAVMFLFKPNWMIAVLGLAGAACV
jgi:protein-S-isoprenylcysteine O-methyltransferase Ste14